MARRRSSLGRPVIPGKGRRHTQPRGIGVERPKRASPETLSQLGTRVLNLLDSVGVPNEAQVPRMFQDTIRNGGVIVLLVVEGEGQNFTVQTADTGKDVTNLYEWSKDAKSQRVTDDQGVRTGLAPENIENIVTILQALETERPADGQT